MSLLLSEKTIGVLSQNGPICLLRVETIRSTLSIVFGYTLYRQQKIDHVPYGYTVSINNQLMGVKQLNGFLRKKCTAKSINKIGLQTIRGKTIVIDTSIYLYRFMSERALMENMYLLISVLLSYDITPLFVFDGKPPPEKYELLRKRRLAKRSAEEKYKLLQELLANGTTDNTKEVVEEMSELRQQFVRIRDTDISMVQDLMDAYGVSYYNAPGEADVVCAYLVRSGQAYACLSDDMDMFMYGCPRVLRNLSLLNRTILYYETASIFNELKINEKQFREMMILSGTDYSTSQCTPIAIETIYDLYQEYIKSTCSQSDIHFYTWLENNEPYKYNLQELAHIYTMYESDTICNTVPDINSITLSNKQTDLKQLTTILNKEGFIFSTCSAY